jgi:hypothetical protein
MSGLSTTAAPKHVSTGAGRLLVVITKQDCRMPSSPLEDGL